MNQFGKIIATQLSLSELVVENTLALLDEGVPCPSFRVTARRRRVTSTR